MNKSKFLKKSLAAVLAVLMVVAMIPLSAAAADDYKPVGLKIEGPNREQVSGTGNSFKLNLNYTPNPTVTISTGTPTDEFVVIREKIDGGQIGSEDETFTDNPDTIPLQLDDDKNPVQFRFYVKAADGSRSADYTIDWTVAAPATTGTATKAVLADEFEGVINESAKTITFTVPFGYAASATEALYYVDFEGCTAGRINADYLDEDVAASTNGAAGSTQGNGEIGTNMLKPKSQIITAETQDGKSDVQYTVYVQEETGLTGIKIGNLETEIEIATADGQNALLSNADYDEGMETGTIKVYVPSTLEPVDGKVKLIPELSISDPNTNATIETIDSAGTRKNTDVVNGKDFDFSYAYGTDSTDDYKAKATKDNTTGVDLILTSTNGATRTYKLVFVRWEDTELTSVKAVDGSSRWKTVDGTIEGNNIEIIVPKTASSALNNITLNFSGPRRLTNNKAAVKVGSKTAVAFNADGDSAAVTAFSYTKPVDVVVTSDDGAHQKVYTLTIKPIEEDTVSPAITSGVLVLKKGSSDEATYNASITQGDEPTVTFTVPHSTTNDEIANGVYTWARNSKATTIDFDNSLGNSNFKPDSVANADNNKGYVAISSATGDTVKYKIVFKRAPARTGKAISDFVLSTEDKDTGNWNLAQYNNNKNYNVTISNGKFTVTLPDKTAGALSANFKLSDGAKLYKYTTGTGLGNGKPNYTLTEVKAVKSDGTIQANVDLDAETNATTAQTYFVADEELATMITNFDSKLLKATAVGPTFTIADIDVDIINNKYSSHMAKYTWNVIEKASNLTRLSSFTDVQGNVKANITNTQDGIHTIELTVPHSYVSEEKEFFIDYSVSNGACLAVANMGNTTDYLYPVYDCGFTTYASGNYNKAASAYNTNPSFVVKSVGDGYALFVTEGGANTGRYQIRNVINGTDETIVGDYFDMYVLAEDGTTLERYNVTVKKADAKTGAQITELTVNGTKASIDHTNKTITANVPYGDNLGQIKIALKASDMAQVKMSKNDVGYQVGVDTDRTNTYLFDKEVAGTYDLRTSLKIEVKSESTLPQVTNVYTLTVKTGEQFSDVPANAWFAPYVKEAFEKGIVNGRGNGLFGPYDNITREDFAVMTGRMLGITVDEDAAVPFTDASSVSDYAKGYVAYFAKEGIIGGYEDSTFRPKGYITREEAAKILAVALDLEVTGTPTFVDTNRISSWARPYVAAVQTAKIFNGDEANRFNGTTRITRAETAKVMVESLKIK